MSNTNLLTAFNDHFVEFVTDVHNVFPEDRDVLTAKNALLAIRKANPKLIVKIWKQFIVSKYRTQIENGDISFFVDKDYSQDLEATQNSDKIMEAINRLRDPIRQMSPDNQEKTMIYIQNLTKLASLVEN